jgi:NAD(P)-dependent dehydrogenase (short-subunit alcohol dehydrogenase family)/3-oxoacyl-(acyl-carrier-protein) synthase
VIGAAGDFSGKCVLVTGAGRGVGCAIALAFARRGAHVIVNYFHSGDQARQTLAEIRALGGSGELVRASVGKRSSVVSLFEAVAASRPRLDVLVNNAVNGVLGELAELDDDDWQRTLDVNLHGVRWCAQAAAPLMGVGGAIVNLSALPAHFILDRYAAVAASKAAQEALTRYLAAELGPRGIRVNTLSAGLVDNDAFDHWPDAEARRRQAGAATALGRLPVSQDIADAAVFLASDAARAVTGTTLLVDAGTSLRLIGLPSARETPLGAAQDVGTEGGEAHPRPVSTPDAVAVVGMGLAVPGASGPEEFWQVLLQDTNTLGEPEHFSLDGWFSPDPKAEDKTHVRAAGFIRGFAPHARLAAELEQGRWAGCDLSTLLLRHCLLQALDTVTTREGDRFGCYVGAPPSSVGLEESMLLAAAITAMETKPAAARVREALRAHYPNAAAVARDALPDHMIKGACDGLLPPGSDRLAVDTACSSSLYAIDLGVKSLLAGERDVVLCGASNTGGRRDLVLFAKLKGLSSNGEVRAFDADASGALFSDAAGIVALKRLDRALADGDEILGLLGGFGGSVDGQGSVLAPDANGQKLAVRRARAVNGLDAAEVGWIVGHGTGTRVGDAVELEGLAELAGPDGHLCTSNKPLVGHGGWSAGVVSVVHALLAFKHQCIPGERYFTRLPDEVRADGITVPLTDAPFPPRPGRRRTAGVCAYGLGGTNGHLVLHGPEPIPSPAPRGAVPPRGEDPVVLVGWQAHLPGEPARDAVMAWLRGEGPAPRPTFGDTYPLPPFQQLRMPPIAARSIDRTHLMAVAVTSAFVEEHGELWARHRESTGVITGNMGPTRSMAEYSIRAGADDLLAAVSAHPAAKPKDVARLREYITDLKERLPAANDDSMPGQLANVISCRVANKYHLNGLALAVDSGHSSTQAALQVASRYLSTGELDVALVLGINGNTTPLMTELTAARYSELAEGAVLLVCTRASLAREHHWPVLATLRTRTANAAPLDRTDPAEAASAPVLDDPGERSYLGADGAIAILRALHSGRPESVISNRDPGPQIVLTAADPQARTPARPHQLPEDQPGQDRATLSWRRAAPLPAASLPSAPRPGSLVLTDCATLAAALLPYAQAARARLVCTDPTAPHADRMIVAHPGAENAAIATALKDPAAPCRDILVVGSTRSATWPERPPPSLLALQECALLAVQALGERLDARGSFTVLMLDPLRGHTLHPHSTLLTGFIRSLAHELPCPTLAVATDATLETGLRQLTAETTAHEGRPVVMYRTGLRYLERLIPAPLPAARRSGKLPWGHGRATVVATGGARGVTAVTVTALAEHLRPRIWLLGTTPADPVPDELLTTPDHELDAARSAFLTHHLKTGPHPDIRETNQRFDALLRRREIQLTLNRLRELCGPQHVHYLLCNLRDSDQVRRAAKTVYAAEGHIDLLLNGAGVIRSAAADRKPLADFRLVRDTKVAGYHHLKSAFTDPPPGLWCNLSSASAVFGLAGDTDYSAANEYLLAAARYAARTGNNEITIGWGLWTETGMVRHLASHLARQFSLTGLTNTEGAAAFLTELTAPRPLEPAPFHGLRRNWQTHAAWADPADPTEHAITTAGLLKPAQDGQHTGPWSWRPEPGRDDYLGEHLIDGRPVLPAVIMLAMAAEAAQHHSAEPTPPVTGFRDFTIDAPLYTDPGGVSASCRVTARTLTPTRIRVEIHSDLTLPTGHALHRNRRHCQVDVLLGPPAPPPPAPPTRPAPRLEDDPSTRPDVSIQLSGIWRTLHRIEADDTGARVLWAPKIEPGSIFARLTIPALLIDSTARLFAIAPLPTGQARVGVPLSLARADIYTTHTDHSLALNHPEGLRLSYSEATDQATAATLDGQTLLTITGLKYHVTDTAPPAIPYTQWQP